MGLLEFTLASQNIPPDYPLCLLAQSPTSPSTHGSVPPIRARDCPVMSPLPARHALIRAKHARIHGILGFSRRRKTQLIAAFPRPIFCRTGSCTLYGKEGRFLGGVDPGPGTCDPADPFLRRRAGFGKRHFPSHRGRNREKGGRIRDPGDIFTSEKKGPN